MCDRCLRQKNVSSHPSCLPAQVGFEFRKFKGMPKMGGIVVPIEHEQAVTEVSSQIGGQVKPGNHADMIPSGFLGIRTCGCRARGEKEGAESFAQLASFDQCSAHC